MLVSSSLKVVNFLEYLRVRIKLKKEFGLYLFVNETYLARTGKIIVYL